MKNAAALKSVQNTGMSVRQRDACDGILRGLPVRDALFAAGYEASRCDTPGQFLRSPKVQKYLSWHEKRQAIRAEDIESHANLRLVRLLEDESTPPMVQALLIRTAHDYCKIMREFEIPNANGMPEEYVEAVIRIKRKLAANTAPDLKTFEGIAHVVEEKLTEKHKPLPLSERQYPGSNPAA